MLMRGVTISSSRFFSRNRLCYPLPAARTVACCQEAARLRARGALSRFWRLAKKNMAKYWQSKIPDSQPPVLQNSKKYAWPLRYQSSRDDVCHMPLALFKSRCFQQKRNVECFLPKAHWLSYYFSRHFCWLKAQIFR